MAERDLVFVSYSHADVSWLERLKVHLRPLERQGAIAVWDDRRIQAGARWREEIRDALARARVAVLLVSPEFLASDFIAEHELPRLLGEEKELAVVWIPVRPSGVEATEVGEYQAAFDPKRTLEEMDRAEADRALAAVTERIEQAYRGRSPGGARPVVVRRTAAGRGRFAVALAAAALGLAVWIALRGGVLAVIVEASPDASPQPPPPGAAVQFQGDVVQNVGPGGNGVIGTQVNAGGGQAAEGK